MEINVKTLPIKVNKKHLESHWWFRVCKVIYILTFLLGMCIVYLAAQSNSKRPVYYAGDRFPTYEVNNSDLVGNLFIYFVGEVVAFWIIKIIFLYIVAGDQEENDI